MGGELEPGTSSTQAVATQGAAASAELCTDLSSPSMGHLKKMHSQRGYKIQFNTAMGTGYLMRNLKVPLTKHLLLKNPRKFRR